MGKQRIAVNFRLPAYRTPRGAWRALIHENACVAFNDAGVHVGPGDRVELTVRLYMDKTKLAFHDVDNRLKDILDALQGLFTGHGRKYRVRQILLPNDAQVWRVIIEKCLPPKQSHGLGSVRVRRYAPAPPRVRRAGV